MRSRPPFLSAFPIRFRGCEFKRSQYFRLAALLRRARPHAITIGQAVPEPCKWPQALAGLVVYEACEELVAG